MAKYTRICCDRVTEITTNSYQEVVVELENIDLSFMFNFEPETIARNSDMYAVLDCLDTDMLKEYIAERFGVSIEYLFKAT